MLEGINQYNILFLDIETVAIKENLSDLEESYQKLWEKKHQTIFRNSDIPFDEGFEDKAAIYAEFGKIVCISCGYLTREDNSEKLRIKSFFNRDEKILLEEFITLLNNNYKDTSSQTISGHNIKEFDIPYLCRRILVNGLKLPEMLNIHGKKPWEVNFIDTLQLWKFGDYKAYTSLNLLANIFGIPTPKDDIDGSMVSAVFWKENNLERIKVYCEKDVITSVRLYQKLRNEQCISEENIEIIS